MKPRLRFSSSGGLTSTGRMHRLVARALAKAAGRTAAGRDAASIADVSGSDEAARRRVVVRTLRRPKRRESSEIDGETA